MPALCVEAYFNDESARDTAYNYVVNNSSRCIWLSQEEKREWDVIVASAGIASYNMKAIIRFPWNLKSKRDEIEETTRNFISSHIVDISKGIIKIHRCYNDAVPGNSSNCLDIIMWSKNWQ